MGGLIPVFRYNAEYGNETFMYIRRTMEELKRIIQKIKEGKLKKLLGELTWMYVYVRRYWFWILMYILLGASGSVLGLGTSVVSRNLVDAVTGVNSQKILEVASLYVGVGVSQIFINAVKMRLSLRIRLKVTNEIRADIYEQVLNTDWASLSKYRSGDLLYRVNGDAGMVANNILTFLPNAVSVCISFVGAFSIVMKNDPAMALIALAGAPISLFMSRYRVKKTRDFQRNNQNLSSDRTVFDQETFQNLQFIKAFSMLDQVKKKFYSLQQDTIQMSLKQNKFQTGTMIITSLVGQIIGYACYGFAVYRLWQGDISYGTMTMFVSMAASLRGSFSSIIGLFPALISAGVSAERIMEVVQLPRESTQNDDQAAEMKKKAQHAGAWVHMEHVDFAYEDEKWVYQDACFRAEPGEIVALIGPSGQGKTTTLNLLLGLYHPRKGRITVGNPGGMELEASSSTRCLFSYIPQGNTLFSGSIADNMRMVNPEASDEEIEEVLKAACAWDFVEKLEDGINTQVRERGCRFSEGQKQRLSIARALLADAPVMILDEATSALDVATERRVLRSIIKKEPHRTVIVAAHRPSVFSMCSRVYKIQDHTVSEVDEEGIHQFLNDF
ncbi:MAG TPA: ABC transporter ATP-binding protein/permease [Candidatus Eubacterium avistercoris]|uniref:ABC transporter ATP-binding protein/permease n=1 Tax=Candidatus Eubacterium avistercoris TaxID=2838567 RepID=A0A9D2D2G1_9FIRM|nr:ABC transporter ATP-binding protein/permease [Candidatus Eubacterium avistercoris]